jgi:HPt (histidine-containing phosphotransfer) domain-containing protein
MEATMYTGFDRDAALDRARGDHQLLAELLQMALEQLSCYMARIHSALRRGDPDEVLFAAHGLEGVAAKVEARRVAGLALELERIGRCGEFGRAAEVLGGLETAIEKLRVEALSF